MNERTKELAERSGLIPTWICTVETSGNQIIKPIDETIIEQFAELIRDDERKSMGVKVSVNEFIAAASKAPNLIGIPVIWTEFPIRSNE